MKIKHKATAVGIVQNLLAVKRKILEEDTSSTEKFDFSIEASPGVPFEFSKDKAGVCNASKKTVTKFLHYQRIHLIFADREPTLF